eukprot:2115274-Rhodomonas_salina.4
MSCCPYVPGYPGARVHPGRNSYPGTPGTRVTGSRGLCLNPRAGPFRELIERTSFKCCQKGSFTWQKITKNWEPLHLTPGLLRTMISYQQEIAFGYPGYPGTQVHRVRTVAKQETKYRWQQSRSQTTHKRACVKTENVKTTKTVQKGSP